MARSNGSGLLEEESRRFIDPIPTKGKPIVTTAGRRAIHPELSKADESKPHSVLRCGRKVFPDRGIHVSASTASRIIECGSPIWSEGSSAKPAAPSKSRSAGRGGMNPEPK
jgi:hypothetical protein